MTYQWAAATHQGRVRANNEDSMYPATAGSTDGSALVMVADGMGGHVAGEVASRLAVEAATTTEGGVAERVLAGNRAILETVEGRPDLAGMGTTLTLAHLRPDLVADIGHVGDSRAYLLRNGELVQVTADHTVVYEQLQAGRITVEEAATHRHRSMVTRALGLIPDVNVDVIELPLKAGDRMLLCSDGVNAMISDREIEEALGSGTPEEVVWDLIERANRAGGHDNATALVVDILP